tara:strand:+ start:3234 stop:3638 length:405 start_codon:yes stop_codon:yes gene_type:complete
MIIQPSNFDSARKITISPRRLEEGYFIEFNYKKRDGSSQQYDCIVLDVYPPGGYVWALKLNDMRKTEFKKFVDRFDVMTETQKGESFQKLDVPEKGKQSYQMIQRVNLVQYYRKFIMSEMSLVRIRPLDFDSLV